MSTPATLDEFHMAFSSWPEDSLSNRTDHIGPGSSWDSREIGTFQVLRNPPKKAFPSWLEAYINEANTRVKENESMQSVLRLFSQNWRDLTHENLTRSTGPLASFVTLLSQVLETAICSDPHRELRAQTRFQEFISTNAPSSGLSPSSQMSSSPPEYPNKKVRNDRSSSSYWPSDESDQSSHDQRTKSEATTNSCIYELLRCITEISRTENDPQFRLEWTITQDTLTVQAGIHQYKTTNDGSLVHRDHRGGYWQRSSDHCYCSIEAKSWHDTLGKSHNVQAQEAAHLIAMFSQKIRDENYLQHDITVPLVSSAQNYFSLVLGTFPTEYEQYLQTGLQSEQLAFAKIEEYGMFKMQDPDELRTIFTIIVALNLKLQSLGEVA